MHSSVLTWQGKHFLPKAQASGGQATAHRQPQRGSDVWASGSAKAGGESPRGGEVENLFLGSPIFQ